MKLPSLLNLSIVLLLLTAGITVGITGNLVYRDNPGSLSIAVIAGASILGFALLVGRRNQ